MKSTLAIFSIILLCCGSAAEQDRKNNGHAWQAPRAKPLITPEEIAKIAKDGKARRAARMARCDALLAKGISELGKRNFKSAVDWLIAADISIAEN